MSGTMIRASRPCVSARTTLQSPIALTNRLSFSGPKHQRAVVVFAAEESPSIDSEQILKDVKAKWDAVENKPQFVMYTVAAVTGVWFTAQLLGAVDRFPLIPKAFELVGISYSIWFTYRYLLFKSTRVELIKEVEALKEKLTGDAAQ
ncbi:hypothetical protein CEUSTIGMA_g11808.t1 [Chlamydomonas eustigma]|uniref:Cyanobacterial aminoacyl-tRNA synthetase CAAD domain-containing protein n=1 Tax=Chlamydomonas eustigma TaxID=1157962 RepID=A0A250XMZ4_9CHLO|nr:hypothetical protein CEUSTIGMA_g11808.t1 [Chlamydomonas eustigma]|eukprot:GAX84386.1 hypothetical protein CEUSTIGMA_g11808.t1 [Chlamydomonas eustigma]